MEIVHRERNLPHQIAQMRSASCISTNFMKTRTVQVLLLATITALSAFLGTGCETMQGAGKDIEKTGNKIQDAAK